MNKNPTNMFNKLKKIIDKPNPLFIIKNNILFSVNRSLNPLRNTSSMLPHKFFGYDIIKQSHDIPLAGHLGSSKTFHKISIKHWWPDMRKEIYDYVKSCKVCQKIKGSKTK